MKETLCGSGTVFFERLLITLNKRGILTLKDLSKNIKISAGTIQGWKKEGSIPHPRIMKKLCEELNVSKEWLTGGTDTEPIWEKRENLPSAPDSARFNFEYALRSSVNHPEGERAVHWLGTMMLMVSSGIDSKGDETMEKIVHDIVKKIFKSARGEKVEIG